MEQLLNVTPQTTVPLWLKAIGKLLEFVCWEKQ